MQAAFVRCRGALLPDPRHDAVRAIVLAVADDDEEVPDGEEGGALLSACTFCVSPHTVRSKSRIRWCPLPVQHAT